MAQVAIVPSTQQRGSELQDEAFEIEQCENLVRFRDEILSGSHPHIKPPQLPAKQALQTTEPSTSGDHRHLANNAQAFHGNSRTSVQGIDSKPSSLGGMANGTNGVKTNKAFGPRKAEINPVLLEKSEDLIKAEIQLQRQRLERTLRDQLEQKRASTKAPQQTSESSTGIDVAGVFSKALAAEQPNAQTTDTTAANASASSDSFDDNTFYSSQHDTPDSQQTSKLPHENDDEEMRDGSPYEPELDFPPSPPVDRRHEVPGLSSYQTAQVAASQLQNVIGSSTLASLAYLHPQQIGAVAQVPENANNNFGASQIGIMPGMNHAQSSGETSHSAESGSSEKELNGPSGGDDRVGSRLLTQALRRRDSPLVRAHNLSPIAPQPAHVSALAITRQPAFDHQEAAAQMATPAQVASLRNEQSATSTPESSPQGRKNVEKKKNKKKKKRKADRLGPAEAATTSPRVKTEPQSPSPFSAPSNARPHKRLRQGHSHFQAGLEYEENRRNEPILIDDNDEIYQHSRRRGVGDGGGLTELQRYEPRRDPPDPATTRYDRGYLDDGRVLAGSHGQQPTSPSIYGRAVRTASHSYLERPYFETPGYLRESRDASIMSVQPGASRGRSRSPVMHERQGSVMLPPRVQPRRILVDEYGREYIEPLRSAPVLRETLAPEAYPTDSITTYGRVTPVRTLARRPETYEEGSVIYRGQSPPYSAPRRVVTQPDFPLPVYRTYREREYSTQPTGPPGEDYLPTRRVDVRDVRDLPREFVARAASVRPPTERYDRVGIASAGTYGDRIAEARPHVYMSARSASVRPIEHTRYEMPPGYERGVTGVAEEDRREYGQLRAASVRPAEMVRYADIPLPNDYRVGSVRPETQTRRDYPISAHSEIQREAIPLSSDSRAYSVVLSERPFQAASRGHAPRQDEHYRPSTNIGEAIYMDRPSQSSYQ